MRRSAALVLIALALPASLSSAKPYNARTNYILHCQGCHGESGLSRTPKVVPPLTGSVGYFLRVPGGRAYLAQVPGASQAPITDAELAELLTYMVGRFSPAEAGSDFAPFTEAEVTAVRRRRPDIVALRADLVARVKRDVGANLWTEVYETPETAR